MRSPRCPTFFVSEHGAEPRALARWLERLVRLAAQPLEGNLRKITSLADMLYRDGYDVPIDIEVQIDVLGELTGLRGSATTQFE